MAKLAILTYKMDIPCGESLCYTPARWAITSHPGVPQEFHLLCDAHMRDLIDVLIEHPELGKLIRGTKLFHLGTLIDDLDVSAGLEALNLTIQAIQNGVLTADQVMQAFKDAGLAIDFTEEILGEAPTPLEISEPLRDFMGDQQPITLSETQTQPKPRPQPMKHVERKPAPEPSAEEDLAGAYLNDDDGPDADNWSGNHECPKCGKPFPGRKRLAAHIAHCQAVQ